MADFTSDNWDGDTKFKDQKDFSGHSRNELLCAKSEGLQVRFQQ